MPSPNERTHPNADAFPHGVGGPVLRALAAAGIRSLEELARRQEADLAAMHGVGSKGMRILTAAMAERGLAFRSEG